MTHPCVWFGNQSGSVLTVRYWEPNICDMFHIDGVLGWNRIIQRSIEMPLSFVVTGSTKDGPFCHVSIHPAIVLSGEYRTVSALPQHRAAIRMGW